MMKRLLLFTCAATLSISHVHGAETAEEIARRKALRRANTIVYLPSIELLVRYHEARDVGIYSRAELYGMRSAVINQMEREGGLPPEVLSAIAGVQEILKLDDSLNDRLNYLLNNPFGSPSPAARAARAAEAREAAERGARRIIDGVPGAAPFVKK